MATKIRGITVEIGGDTAGLEKSLKDVNKEIGDTSKQLKDVERLLKLDPTNTELLAQKQELLSRRVEQSTSKLDALKKAQETMDKNGIDKNSDQYMALQREIISTEKAVESDKKEVDKLTKAEKENAGAAEKTSKSHEGFGKALKGVGVAAAAATAAVVAVGKGMWDAAKATGQYGDSIDDESQKLQISASLYQKLGYALEQSGSDIESVKKGVLNITTALGNMGKGVEGADDKFTALGVSLKDGEGNLKTTESVLLDTIDALANMEDETQRNNAANEIFGKSYSELLPLLNAGADGMASLMQEAEDYGMVMDEDAIKASSDFADTLKKLEKTFEGLKNSAMADVLPALTQLLDGMALVLSGDMTGTDKISQGIESLLGKLSEAIPRIVSFVGDVAGAVLEAAPEILASLSEGITSTLPDLLPVVVDLIMAFAQFLIDEAPELVETAISLVLALVSGITSALPELIPAAVDMVISICDALIDNLDLLIDGAISLVVALALGIIDNLPKLVAKIPDLIEALVVAIIEHTPELIVASIQILVALARGLIQSVGILVKKAPELISAIGQAIADAAVKLWEIGKNIVDGLWEGIKNAWHSVVEWVQNAISNLVGGIKDFLGIRSPSRLMMSVGDMMAEGLGIGFVKEMDKVADQMEDAIPTLGVRSSYSNIVTSSAAQNAATASNNALQQASAGIVNGLAAVQAGGGTYTFNLVLPSGEVLARYQLPSLIEVARASGTPILNPSMG